MWEAQLPIQDNGSWLGLVREHTMQFPCHMARKAGAWGGWFEGTHRTAAAALSCAERAARERNKAAGR